MSATASPVSGSRRLAYIDWARGLAVLLMIEAHVSTRGRGRRRAGTHSSAT